jgi:hypothetical protein
MKTANDILSNIYLEMLEENVDSKMVEAIIDVLWGRKFNFEFVGSVEDDREMEYLSYADTPLDKAQIYRIAKAFLNGSLSVSWEGKKGRKPTAPAKQTLEKVQDAIFAKYNEINNNNV